MRSGAVISFLALSACSERALPLDEATSLHQPLHWEIGPDMPTGRYGLGAATGRDGRIYAVGGIVRAASDDRFVSTVEVYDPVSQQWARAADMVDRLGLASAIGVPDGRLYAFGDDGATSSGKVNAYSPTADTWVSQGATSTHRRSNFAVTGDAEGWIHLLGGEGSMGSALATMDAYLPAENRWTVEPGFSIARTALAATTDRQGRIYAIGGFAREALSAVEIYAPARPAWSRGPALPTARYALAATTGADGRIYVIGGEDQRFLSTVEIFDAKTGAWIAGPAMPTARAALALATGADGRIYAIGGFSSNEANLRTVEVLVP